ncbi:MAG TPA: glucosyl-3-phosphoglycerate synthase [Solirubrobacteraceae bacterium]|nr:glucosyl-3-phosphoglycerate synthase [Solirubrobacteraceae bacterium]
MTALPPPDPRLRASVVVPARDEEALVGRCVRALAAQRGVAPAVYEVLLVLDRCTDGTAEAARAAADRHPGLRLHLLDAPTPGVGHARRAGMDLACARLLAVHRPDGLIASTDADSEPDPDWLRVQLDAVAQGARAIGGRVELSGADRAALPPLALARREREARERLARARERADAHARVEHHQFSGASLGVTAAVYEAVGRMPPRIALEDEGFERLLERHGIAIQRLADVRVTTSGRREARAVRGLAVDLRRSWWQAERSYRGVDFTLERLLAAKRRSVSLVLPAREVAGTIGAVLDAIGPLSAAGLVDEVVVLDAASRDGTAAIAAARGARVLDESTVLPEHGSALGKGDAMWRGVSATRGEVVAFLDTDTEDFHAGFVLGLLGPILCEPEVGFVKGAFRRPLRIGDTVVADGGGRVTELVARPFLNLHVPELAVFRQPLAGEIAADRSLLERLPFPVGYGIEIAMLIDALREVGLERMAQVDLGTRQNRHQPLRELSAMALAVLAAAERRVHGADAVDAAAPGPLLVPDGADLVPRFVMLDERPPLRSLRGAAEESAA